MALTKVNASNIVDGVLPVANGGTGASTQGGAANAVLPSQGGNSGKYLTTNGTDASWGTIASSQWTTTGSDIYYNTGNVGIGTSSPNYKLSIYDASTPRIQLTNSTTGTATTDGYVMYINGTAAYFLNREADATYFGNNNTVQATLDSSGNLGIGTSSPGVKLDVNGGSIRAIASGGTPYIYLNNGTTQHSISNSSGAMPFAIDGTERMRIDSSGNVGIGTSSPTNFTNSKVLEVAGGTNTGAVLASSNSGTVIAEMQGNNGDGLVYYGSRTNHPIVFRANGIERLRIGTSGQLGIGGANYGTSGQVLVSQGSGAAPVWGSGGKVLQVVQTVLATAFSASTSGNTFTNITGLSVNITPTSASNKILILVDVSLNSGGVDGAPFRITRGGTAVGVGSPAGSRQAATGVSASNVTNGSQGTVSGKYLDSPATTSQITYQIQALSGGSGGTFYVNRTASYSDGANGYNTTPISTITVMEIAA